MRLARAEQIEIGSVQHIDCLRHFRELPRVSSRWQAAAAAAPFIRKAPAKGKPERGKGGG
jgi:hypothetical protein